MKSVIIPLDFSDTSINAARYAAGMFAGKSDTLIYLYSMFKEDEESYAVTEYLESLKEEFNDKGVPNVEFIKEMGDEFLVGLENLAFQKTASLIIMGINDKSELAQKLKGSNALKMAERNVCPVMIIPPNATYTDINNIVFTSDFKDVENTTPMPFIKKVLDMFNANLHIVNVDSEHYISITEKYEEEREKLKEMFADYTVEFYFLRLYEFTEAILQFTKDLNIDMIITVPRHHSVLEKLLKGSHTRDLAFHSEVPVVAVNESL